MADELKIIYEARIFPCGIYECFADAYFTLRDKLSRKDLKEIRKHSLRALERRRGNLIFRDLVAHAETITVDSVVLEKLTCVPKYMKMTLLKEGDLGKPYYEKDRSVTYENLRYEIIEEFIRNHDFAEKEDWDDLLSEEILAVEKSGYFPKNIFICFQEALWDFWRAVSLNNIREIKRALKNCDKEEENGK